MSGHLNEDKPSELIERTALSVKYKSSLTALKSDNLKQTLLNNLNSTIIQTIYFVHASNQILFQQKLEGLITEDIWS